MAFLSSPGALLPDEPLGDLFYKKGEYDLARIEYEREMERAGQENLEIRKKIGLSLMRQRRYRDSLDYLYGTGDFALLYLRMYASLKEGEIQGAMLDQQEIEKDQAIGEDQRFYSRIIAGTIYLESGDYASATNYYTRIQKESRNDRVRRSAGHILTGLREYEKVPSKNPWVAGALSAALPGAGQYYSGFESDAITAFTINLVLIGGTAYMYNLEKKAKRPHTGSGLFGLVALVFYGANILGAFSSARRHNIYHEREFQEGVRRDVFNTDFIEETSGIGFTTNF